MLRCVMLLFSLSLLLLGCASPTNNGDVSSTPAMEKETATVVREYSGLVLTSWRCETKTWYSIVRGNPPIADYLEVSGNLRNDGGTLKDIRVKVQWLASDKVLLSTEDVWPTDFLRRADLVPGEGGSFSSSDQMGYALGVNDDYIYCRPRITSEGKEVEYLAEDFELPAKVRR